MSYENAPATILLATHCACCGRPLVDAASVTRGVGPDCAEKYGFTVEIDPAAREEANVIVHRIAAAPKAETVEADIERLRALGLTVLADRLVERLGEEPTVKIEVNEAGAYVVRTPYSETFVATLKAAAPYGERRWDKPSKTWIVAATSKAALWAALSAGFAGKIGIGPKGRFTVAAAVAAPVASEEPPAAVVAEDGSVNTAAWVAAEEERLARVAPTAKTGASDFSRPASMYEKGYRKTTTGAWMKRSRWIGGYNC